MITQKEINVQGEPANKIDNHIASCKHRTERIQYKSSNGDCTIITYPAVEVKYTWQVYVTSELKIKLFCFFTVRTMVWIFIVVQNRYLNLSTVLKLLTTQNKTKGAEKN